MGQPVAFFEVTSSEPERAQKFYAELFGWHITPDPEMGGYALVDTQSGDGAIPGGIGAPQEAGDTGVKIYMRVDDLDAYLGRAAELGGTPLVPPMDLPGEYGRIAILADPDGNAVGLWS